jgi:uncharacterized protein
MRAVWLATGLGCVGLGVIGAVLPLLPTTPFLLLAAFAFAKSSDRLHTWLLNHNIFGGLIEQWRRYGAISSRVKVVSVSSMAGIFALSLALDVAPALLIVQAIVLTAVAIFVLSRPLPPQL